MSNFDKLDNVGPFKMMGRIQHDIQKVVELEDVDRMLNGTAVFLLDMAHQLADVMELKGRVKKEFINVHTTTEEIVAAMVGHRNKGEVSPETIRLHFLTSVIPDLIHNALLPFGEKKADRERQAVLPYIAALHDCALEFASAWKKTNPAFAEEARAALGGAKMLMTQRIRGSSTIN